MSLYWLLPSIAAITSSAGDVLAVTEDPISIGRLSPPGEVLRGMGMWTSYIVLDGQIENPEQLALLTSPPVIAAGFGLFVLGLTGLMAASRRIQALAGSLIVGSIVVMLGVNSSGWQGPLGQGLTWLFEHLPAAAAFRTTNKLGSGLVLGLALAIGAGLGTERWQRLFRVREATAVTAVVVVAAIAAGPILPGQLHPLQIPIPDYWFVAADATDQPADHRLAFLPGNAQTRYLWGYRGVDDLDLALFDQRNVVWRSTIPAGSAPATNALTAFDLGLQLGNHQPASLQTRTQMLGIGDALVRTDIDWIRNFGRPSGQVLADVLAAPGTGALGEFGPDGAARGLPEWIVPPDAPALTHVGLPTTTVAQAWPVDAPLLVVGDNMAVDQLVRAGMTPSTRPMLFVNDLDDDQLRTALAAGGRLVLSDTNHRRRWQISSTTDSYTPLLPPETSVPASEQRALYPAAQHQTVADDDGPVVEALDDPYDLLRQRAAGRPEFAFDGNPLTGWQYGNRTSGEGGWVEVRVDQAALVQAVEVLVGTQGKTITRIGIETDGKELTIPVVDGVARAEIGQRTGRVRVYIDETFGEPSQPASVLEVSITGDDAVWRPVQLGARLPETLDARFRSSPDLRASMRSAPLSIELSRLLGNPADTFDDEEVRLRRRMSVPWEVEIDPTAVRGTVRPSDDASPDDCRVVARISGRPGTGTRLVRARFVEPTPAGTPGEVRGCGPAFTLPSGTLVLTAHERAVVDHLSLSTAPPQGSPARQLVHATSRTPTSATFEFASGLDEPVVLSSGRAWHPAWEATADGEPLGRPIITAGYAAGWVVPAGTTTVTTTFGPQRLTTLGQTASAAVVLAAAAMAAFASTSDRRSRR